MLVNSIQTVDYRNNLAFTGMTKTLKKEKRVDGKKDLVGIAEQRQLNKKSTRVGQLPGFMFDRINQNTMNAMLLLDSEMSMKTIKDVRERAINEIMTAFEETANEIRAFKPGAKDPIDEIRNRRPQSSVERLKDVLMKYNLVDEPDKFDIKKLDAGEYKTAYKIEGIKDEKTGEELCFKVFHVIDKTPEWHKYKCHGNYAELNSAVYWQAHVGSYTEINKFYFGDMVNGGYIVSRYVPLQNNFPWAPVDKYNYGLKSVDAVKDANGHNKKANFYIDEGDDRTVNRIKNRSKTACYVLKQMKNTPEKYRYSKWFEILYKRKDLDDVQKKAGLALSLKHMPEEYQEELILECMDFNEPMVDQSLAYALKYLPVDRALKYYRALMQRKEPVTQEILMNEIPLLSKKDDARFDDIDTSKFEIDPETVYRYCKLSQKYVLPSVENHLASYLHLLPDDKIIPEATRMVQRGDYATMDRMLHKAKFVDNEQYHFSDKKTIIELIQSHTKNEFLQKKAHDTLVYLIRQQQSED